MNSQFLRAIEVLERALGRRPPFVHAACSAAALLCGRDAVQLRPRQQTSAVDFAALAARLTPHATVTSNEFLLQARLTDGDKPFEITLFPNGRAIIKGTQEPDVARGIYSKYIGT